MVSRVLDRRHYDNDITTITAAPLRCWLDRVSDHIWQALEVDRIQFVRGTRPGAHVGRSSRDPIRSRNSSASGQLVANANLILLAVSLIRTATFNNRSRMVENSPLASVCGFGIVSRTVNISQ